MEHAFTPNYRNPERMNRNVTEYITSPTMAGGLFAANKDFFMEIGGYDRGMLYWGVENVEFSFRCVRNTPTVRSPFKFHFVSAVKHSYKNESEHQPALTGVMSRGIVVHSCAYSWLSTVPNSVVLCTVVYDSAVT